MDLNHILNWRLRAGSHEFPGPDGGTCINEAAIVAAGFEYRAVQSWRDCPPCFSPVLAQALTAANDRMGDWNRQHLLLPFVTRLAGSRKDPGAEVRRARLIAVETVRRVLPAILRLHNCDEQARACERVPAGDLLSASVAGYNAQAAAGWPRHEFNPGDAAYGVHAAGTGKSTALEDAINAAAHAATVPTRAGPLHPEIWRITVKILGRALGRPSEPLENDVAAGRMERAKTLVPA